MKTKLLIIFFLWTSSISAQIYSSAVTDKEIYDFLSWLTVNSKGHFKGSISEPTIILNKISDWDSSNIYIPKDTSAYKAKQGIEPAVKYQFQYLFKYDKCIDPILNKADIEFIKYQFQSIKDTSWHKTFDNSKLIRQNEAAAYCTYSIPFFTEDRKFVIVKVDSYNHMFGSGGFDIYQKTGEKTWKFICRLHSWQVD